MKSDKKIGVYILICANKRYYIGSTNDLERRLTEHHSGFVPSTKNVRPVALKAFYPFSDIRQARQIEYKIKRKKSRLIIDKIINDGYMKFMGS